MGRTVEGECNPIITTGFLDDSFDALPGEDGCSLLFTKQFSSGQLDFFSILYCTLF